MAHLPIAIKLILSQNRSLLYFLLRKTAQMLNVDKIKMTIAMAEGQLLTRARLQHLHNGPQSDSAGISLGEAHNWCTSSFIVCKEKQHYLTFHYINHGFCYCYCFWAKSIMYTFVSLSLWPSDGLTFRDILMLDACVPHTVISVSLFLCCFLIPHFIVWDVCTNIYGHKQHGICMCLWCLGFMRSQHYCFMAHFI